MLIYVGLSAVALLVATLLLQAYGGVPVVTAHLLFAGGIVPLIFAAMIDFMPVLTRGPAAHRGIRWLPLIAQAAGAVVVISFRWAGADPSLLAAMAVILALTALLLASWLVVRARRTLGHPHPCWRWYLAAVWLLVLALTLVPAMICWPEHRHALRLIHLHLNLLGFIGLTALGTLQVLLPTALGGPDPGATTRLREELPKAVAAVVALAVGAAIWLPLGLVGALLLGAVTLKLGRAWVKRYDGATLGREGAGASLFAALVAFALMLVLGAAHGFRIVDPQDAVISFAAAFLLPLVSGALTQLLPVWCYPGKWSPQRQRLRADLEWAGAFRSMLFVCGGCLLALGSETAGLALAAAGALLFLVALLRGGLRRF